MVYSLQFPYCSNKLAMHGTILTFFLISKFFLMRGLLLLSIRKVKIQTKNPKVKFLKSHKAHQNTLQKIHTSFISYLYKCFRVSFWKILRWLVQPVQSQEFIFRNRLKISLKTFEQSQQELKCRCGLNQTQSWHTKKSDIKSFTYFALEFHFYDSSKVLRKSSSTLSFY